MRRLGEVWRLKREKDLPMAERSSGLIAGLVVMAVLTSGTSQ